MSVINDVLKELKGRESRFTPLDLAADGPADATPARRGLPRLLLLLLLAVIAGGWLYQWSGGAMPTMRSTPAAQAAAPSPSARPQAPATPVESAIEAALPEIALEIVEPLDDIATPVEPGNAIIGLQLREADDGLHMEFVLRERAVAYLKQRNENGFAYHLGDIESRIAAPLIDDNRWLEQLDIVNALDGVDIRFVTAPDVLVETGQARGDGEFVWAISLRRSAPTAAATRDKEITRAAAVSTLKTAKAEPKAEPKAAPVAAPVAAPKADRVAALPVSKVDAAGTTPADEVRVDIRATEPVSNSQQQLQLAVEMLGSQRYARAENLLRELLGGTEDYEARRHLLGLYVGRQQHQRVALLARDSARRYPGDPLFATEYARSLFQQSAYRDVVLLLESLDALDSRQLSLLAVSYQRLERHDLAIRYFRLALQQDATSARNWVGLGISQEQSAAPGDALTSYQQALEIGNLNERLQAYALGRHETLRKVIN